jgi:hypothetical protein
MSDQKLRMGTLEERLNQPRTSRLEMLEQFRATMSLTPSAEEEYQKLKRGSAGGRKKTASRVVKSPKRLWSVESTQ